MLQMWTNGPHGVEDVESHWRHNFKPQFVQRQVIPAAIKAARPFEVTWAHSLMPKRVNFSQRLITYMCIEGINI